MSVDRRTSPVALKLLWGRAAARCTLCRVVVVEGATATDPHAVLGEAAHIVAHGDGGPRADPAMPAERRNAYDNLILLCPTCHTRIDKQPGKWTVSALREKKESHESWVCSTLEDGMSDVRFEELEAVCRGIIAETTRPTDNFELTIPREKLARNGMSERVDHYVRMGMLQCPTVKAYLGEIAMLDPEFPERLKSGFVQRHRASVEAGLSGDALFHDLMEFASRGGDFPMRAAGLSVLIYLFEACEVFER